MASEPKAPGAAAIYLERQIDRDDSNSVETVYERIKILTDEGRKYADVAIAFIKGRETIRGVKARSIRSDGTITEFNGEIYERPITKTRGVNYQNAVFTLPDVQVGSIIEYRYRRDLPSGYIFDSRWILNADLFTKHGKFSLRRYPDLFSLTWAWPNGLPAGTEPPVMKGGMLRLEVHDVPAFQSEDHMPPESALKYRVDFIYSDAEYLDKDPNEFWKKYGKRKYKQVNDFIDEQKAMERAVATIVQPEDSPQTKLRKIYARIQQLRNLSYERDQSEQEGKRANLKEAHDVADVWEHGYGDGFQLSWLFLALVRAAGITADPVLVSTRDQYIFDPRMMNPSELNTNVVLVMLDGKEIYLDPGTRFAPFGLLPWYETGVKGLRLTKQGGSWVTTSVPSAEASRIVRKATLQLTADGSLKGTVTVTFRGLEALWRRIAERNEDATHRKIFLENEFKGFVPTGVDVELTNAPDWGSASDDLVAEYALEVPGWGQSLGRRLLLAVGLFAAEDRHTFEHAERVHPLYFDFIYEREDDITIALPQGVQVAHMPEALALSESGLSYRFEADSDKRAIHLRRVFQLGFIASRPDYYPQARGFFQAMRTADEEQIIVTKGPSS